MYLKIIKRFLQSMIIRMSFKIFLFSQCRQFTAFVWGSMFFYNHTELPRSRAIDHILFPMVETVAYRLQTCFSPRKKTFLISRQTTTKSTDPAAFRSVLVSFLHLRWEKMLESACYVFCLFFKVHKMLLSSVHTNFKN